MEKIRIPKPCHENWNEMSPEEKGRHCAVCNKTVIDFTENSLPEIHQFLQIHSEQKICGRFNHNDVEPPTQYRNWIQRKAINFYQFAGKKQFSGFAASFSVLLLFLVGCKKEVTGDISITDDTKMHPKDSTVSIKDSMNDIEIGKVEITSKDTLNCAKLDIKKPVPIKEIKPKVMGGIPPVPKITGDIAMPENPQPKEDSLQ